MYIQPFSMGVDWPEICCVMEVSTLFYFCRYCVFTLWGRADKHNIRINWKFRNKLVLFISTEVCCKKFVSLTKQIFNFNLKLKDPLINFPPPCFHSSVTVSWPRCPVCRHRMSVNSWAVIWWWISWHNVWSQYAMYGWCPHSCWTKETKTHHEIH